MFGVEPQQNWSREEAEEFELYARERFREVTRSALRAAVAFALNAGCIVPFLDGHSLHRYWGAARYLIWTAMALLVWLVYKVALIWAAWQSARETRREFGDTGQISS
jgi:hypothetical protein